MEKKSSLVVILVVVIAFLSLTVTIMSVLIFASPSSNDIGSNVKQSMSIPGDDSLKTKRLYSDDVILNLASLDDRKLSVIKLNIDLIYFKDIKKIDEKLEAYDGRIKEAVATYFQKLTIEDVRKPETKEMAKKDLIDELNKILNENEKMEKQVIYSISFPQWFYQ